MHIDTTRPCCISAIIGAGMLLGMAQSSLACTVTGGSGNPNDIGSNLAPGVTLTVTGVCVEDVVITHDDVTIQSGATNAIIKSKNPADKHDAILIDGAKRVLLRKLTVSRGRYGIRTLSGASFRLFGSNIVNAEKINVYVFGGSTAYIRNTRIKNAADGDGIDPAHGIVVSRSSHAVVQKGIVSGNSGWGIVSTKASHVEVLDSTVESNAGDAAFAARSASMTISGSTITNNGWGVGAYNAGHLEVRDGTTIENNAVNQVDVFSGSNADIRDATINSNADTNGGESGISVGAGSSLTLEDTTITALAGAGGNLCCGYGVFAYQAAFVRLNEGNSITSNGLDGNLGVAVGAYHNTTVDIRGGTDNTNVDTQFNTLTNTAGNWGNCAYAGLAMDIEQQSWLRISRGHTVISGTVTAAWNSYTDLRDVNITGDVVAGDELTILRFRDQGTVPGNVTLEGGQACLWGNPTQFQTPQTPTFDADVNCRGSSQPLTSPNFINGHNFVNCL